MNVADVVLIALGAVSATTIGVGVYILYRFYVRVELTIGTVAAYAAARGDEPSYLALLWDSMVDRAVSKISMGQLGVKSGEARQEKSARVEYIKSVVADEQPMIAMALDRFFPKWGKMLADNPQIMPQMMEFVKTKMGGSGEKEPVSNGTQQRFPL